MNQQPDGPKSADRNHVHGFPPASTPSAKRKAQLCLRFSIFLGADVISAGLEEAMQIRGVRPRQRSVARLLLAPPWENDLHLASARIDDGDQLFHNNVAEAAKSNNLVLWMFEKGKRCSVTWIRNTLSADGEPALEVTANLFTASGTGGRPRCHA
jgi:hypothetical protein